MDLTPIANAAVELIGVPKRAGNMAIVTIGARNPERPDLYSIELASGRLRRLVVNTGVTDFYTDELGRARAGLSIDVNGTMKILKRREGSWAPIYSAPPTERLTVLGLSPDGSQIIVRSNRDRPSEQLLTVNLTSGAVRPLVPHKCGPFDADQVYWDSLTSKVFAVSCTTDKASLVPIEAAASKAIAEVRRLSATDSAISLVSQSAGTNAAIFSAEASDRPTRYLSYANGHASYLPNPRPWLAKYQWQKSSFQFIAARDGLPIPIYLTRAPAVGPQPMVIEIHGDFDL